MCHTFENTEQSNTRAQKSTDKIQLQGNVRDHIFSQHPYASTDVVINLEHSNINEHSYAQMHEQQINGVNNAGYISDEHTYASRTSQFTHCHSSLSESSTISHNLENANSKNYSNIHTYSSINISGPLRKEPCQGSISKTLPANDTVQIQDEANFKTQTMTANSNAHNFKSTQNTSRKRSAQQSLHNPSPTFQKQNKREKHGIFLSEQEKKLQEAVENLVCHMKCQHKMKLILSSKIERKD